MDLITETADFNPRSREGSDMTQARKRRKMQYFNPRSREGSDTKQLGTQQNEQQFQSTLP